MRYSIDQTANEAQKIANGERDKVTSEQVANWLGSDNLIAEAWELLLDILNDQVPVNDCVKEVLSYGE